MTVPIIDLGGFVGGDAQSGIELIDAPVELTDRLAEIGAELVERFAPGGVPDPRR